MEHSAITGGWVRFCQQCIAKLLVAECGWIVWRNEVLPGANYDLVPWIYRNAMCIDFVRQCCISWASSLSVNIDLHRYRINSDEFCTGDWILFSRWILGPPPWLPLAPSTIGNAAAYNSIVHLPYECGYRNMLYLACAATLSNEHYQLVKHKIFNVRWSRGKTAKSQLLAYYAV